MYRGYVRLLDVTSNLFTMFRWNNKPTIMRTNEAENAFISSHFAMLMSELSKDAGIVIKEEKLYERIVLKELPKCVLSDISVDTKNLIRELAPDKWKQVYETAVEEILGYVNSSRREQFSDSLFQSRDESTEGRIIAAADLMSARLEAEIHARFFPDHFSQPIHSLIERTSRFSAFKPYNLLKQASWLESYEASLLVLLRSIRWNRMNRNVKTTVAGHSFYVSVIAFVLACMENDAGNHLDTVEVTKRALLHDISESLTGDIITPTKKKVTGFDEVISRVEEKMLDKELFSKMPKELVQALRERSLNPFTGNEGELVRCADMIAAVIECLLEGRTGNSQTEFRLAFDSLIDQLGRSSFESVRYVADLFRWGLNWAGKQSP
jgi:putative hydrolase of HD superfamily